MVKNGYKRLNYTFLAFIWSIVIFHTGLFLFRRHSRTYRENLSRQGLPPSPFLLFASWFNRDFLSIEYLCK